MGRYFETLNILFPNSLSPNDISTHSYTFPESVLAVVVVKMMIFYFSLFFYPHLLAYFHKENFCLLFGPFKRSV